MGHRRHGPQPASPVGLCVARTIEVSRPRPRLGLKNRIRPRRAVVGTTDVLCHPTFFTNCNTLPKTVITGSITMPEPASKKCADSATKSSPMKGSAELAHGGESSGIKEGYMTEPRHNSELGNR